MIFEIKPFFFAVSAVVWKCMADFRVLFTGILLRDGKGLVARRSN